MTDFAYKTVLSTLAEGGVRTIALNRPASLNAMNRQLIDDVARACQCTMATDQFQSGRAFRIALSVAMDGAQPAAR